MITINESSRYGAVNTYLDHYKYNTEAIIKGRWKDFELYVLHGLCSIAFRAGNLDCLLSVPNLNVEDIQLYRDASIRPHCTRKTLFIPTDDQFEDVDAFLYDPSGNGSIAIIQITLDRKGKEVSG